MTQAPIQDMPDAAVAAWDAYTAAYRQLHDDNLAGKSTPAQARELKRLHQAFEALFAGDPEEEPGPVTVSSLTEEIRSAHAMMYGIINIGSFEFFDPDPDDHNATCALIHDVHQLLACALKRADAAS